MLEEVVFLVVDVDSRLGAEPVRSNALRVDWVVLATVDDAIEPSVAMAGRRDDTDGIGECSELLTGDFVEVLRAACGVAIPRCVANRE